MITVQQLRDKLNAMPNVRAVARQAGMSEKTVYRTAWGKSVPNLENAQRIWSAIEALEATTGAELATTPTTEPATSA